MLVTRHMSHVTALAALAALPPSGMNRLEWVEFTDSPCGRLQTPIIRILRQLAHYDLAQVRADRIKLKRLELALSLSS